MKHTRLFVLALVSAAASGAALAHDGHGLASLHWHATDTVGFVLLGAVVAAALWASHRK